MSPEIKASFVKLILYMYIDIHPRQEEKLPEAVKVLNLQAKEDPISKYKNYFNTQKENSLIENYKQRGKTFTVFKNKTDPALANRVFFIGDEVILYNLKEDLIDYFFSLHNTPVFDIFTFELINLASDFVKFKIITTVCSFPDTKSAVINPKDKNFSYEKMDITKLLRSLMGLLLETSLRRFHSYTVDFDKFAAKEKLDEEKEFQTSPMTETLKSIKNFVKLTIEEEKTDFGFINKCKLEICKLLEYVLR